MKKFLFLIIFNVFITFGQSTEGLIGTGTEVSNNLPITTHFGYNYSQQIYLASEVQSALGNNNKITSIKFHFKSPNSTDTFKDWSVFMGNTNKSEFESLSQQEWIPSDNLQQVFNGEVNFPNPTDDWFEIVFDTPFIWDGVSNIVIAVNEYTPNNQYGGEFRKMNTSLNRGIFYRGDNNIPNLSSLPTPSRTVKHVPQLILVGEAVFDCLSPMGIYVSDISASSAKFNFNIVGNYQPIGVEYYLSAFDTPPSDNVQSFEIINNPSRELLLTDLNIDERYFIWFRTKCSEGVYTEWTDSYTFKTLEEGQIGAGEESSSSLPIRSSSLYNYSQQIYLANEVSQAIGDKHYVTKIMFYFTGIGDTEKYKEWKIYIGNTNKSSFEGTESENWVSVSSMQQVYNWNVSFPNNTEGWFEIQLEDPFLWDGISNIVVAVNEYSQGSNAGASFKSYKTADDYRGMLYTNWENISNLGLPNASERMKYVPQIKLIAEQAPDCMTPVLVNSSNITDSSIKISWNNPLSTLSGVEYYYSTTVTEPLESTVASGSVNLLTDEVEITGLTQDTEYYIWLRTVCSATEKSEWSKLPLKFKTLQRGQIGNGDAESFYLPVTPSSAYSYSQQIYLKEELSKSIGNDRYIKKIKFFYEGSVNVERFKDWKIFIGNTTVNNFGESDDITRIPIPISSLIEVFDGSVALENPSNTWVEIDLTSPFLWDGNSNIVIAINEYSEARQIGRAVFKIFDTEFFRGLSYRTNGDNFNLNTLPSENFGYKFVPQIVFVAEPEPSCLIPQNINVTNVSMYSATINFSSVPNASVLGYDYEVRISGEPGTATSGRIKNGYISSDVLSVDLSELNHSTEYSVYVRSKCSDNDFSEWTTARKFETDCYYPDFTIDNVSVCGQGVVTLQVNVDTENVRWFDSETSSSILGNGKTFSTPLLTETRSYWIEVYTGSFMTPLCVSPRKEVVVEVTPAPSLILNNVNLEICKEGITDAVTITTGGSDYNTFTWSPAEGVSGDHLTGWTFTATETTIYVLTATQGEEGNCVNTVKVIVKVNSSPDISSTPEESDITVCLGAVKKFEIQYNNNLEAIIGDGDLLSETTDLNTVFNNSNNSSKSQVIYTAEELIITGFGKGYINSIHFDIESQYDSTTIDNYTVKISTTDKSEFENDSFITEGLTTVYGPSTYTYFAEGWQEIQFSTPFFWDGISNLIIEISHSGANEFESAQTSYTETVSNTLIYSTELFGVLVNTLSNKRYDIKFNGNFNYDIKWSPATNLYIDEAAEIPYLEGESTSKVYYRSSAEGESNLSAEITSYEGCSIVKSYNITIASGSVEPVIVQENQVFCGETRVSDLIVSGQDGATFKWYAEEHSFESLSNDYILSSGDYFVAQKVGDCESTRKKVNLTINSAPNIVLNNTNLDICKGQTTDIVRIISGAGDYTYTWSPAEGVIGDNLIGWNFNPSETTNYILTVNNGIVGECEMSVSVNVIVLDLPETPIGNSVQEFEEGSLISDIVTNQSDVIWFSSLENAENDIDSLENDTPLIEGATYYGIVESSEGCLSTPLAVSVNIKLGVNDFDITKLSYYPNPVKDVLTISYRDVIDSIEVYSLTGQRILFVKSTSNEVIVDMSQFMSSTYVIKIYSGTSSQVIKVIKE